jgi:hypothetical protein
MGGEGSGSALAHFNATLDGSFAVVALVRFLGALLAHFEVAARKEHHSPRVDEAHAANIQLHMHRTGRPRQQ